MHKYMQSAEQQVSFNKAVGGGGAEKEQSSSM